MNQILRSRETAKVEKITDIDRERMEDGKGNGEKQAKG